jgi:ribosomal protein L11 methyltransferase
LIRLALRCRPETAERVLAELLELAPGGVEEERGADYVEYAIYGTRGELPSLPDLKALAGDGTVEASTEEIPDDWADRWRDFHRPIAIGDRMVIRPSWESRLDANPAASRARKGDRTRSGGSPDHDSEQAAGIDVVIDPGSAFGTGAHPTTRMCLELLLKLADAGDASGPLVDLGTGSGVLAIAAAKLGFSPVIGCDHETAALEAARENAVANGVELVLERVNLRERPGPTAATMTANLTGPVLHEVAARLAEGPRRLVCSGLLRREVDGIAAAFAVHGLAESERLEDGDWAALLLVA